MKTVFICSIFLFSMTSCLNSQPLQTVDNVDLVKYQGRWFDIASFPASFQKGCHCSTADYQIVPGKKYISVVNRCIKFKNGKSKISLAKGKAFVVEGSNNAKLKVQFLFPFRGDYYIIGLADDYSWAIVGHPTRKYLWILSRESFMPTDTYNQLCEIILKKGYDLKKLKKTPQNCDIPE